MRDNTLRIVMPLLVVLLCVALVVQALAGRSRRHAIKATAAEICAKHNDGLDVMHDIIVIASTPPKGKTLTAAQIRATAVFQTKAFARIDAARC